MCTAVCVREVTPPRRPYARGCGGCGGGVCARVRDDDTMASCTWWRRRRRIALAAAMAMCARDVTPPRRPRARGRGGGGNQVQRGLTGERLRYEAAAADALARCAAWRSDALESGVGARVRARECVYACRRAPLVPQARRRAGRREARAQHQPAVRDCRRHGDAPPHAPGSPTSEASGSGAAAAGGRARHAANWHAAFDIGNAPSDAPPLSYGLAVHGSYLYYTDAARGVLARFSCGARAVLARCSRGARVVRARLPQIRCERAGRSFSLYSRPAASSRVFSLLACSPARRSVRRIATANACAARTPTRSGGSGRRRRAGPRMCVFCELFSSHCSSSFPSDVRIFGGVDRAVPRAAAPG